MRLADPGLHHFPWLYLAGAGATPPFSVSERAALRRHLQYGGFLLVDSAEGAEGGPFDASVGRSSRGCCPPRRSRRSRAIRVLHKSFYLLDRQGPGAFS